MPESSPPIFDVFLAYAGPDRDLAQDLVQRLHGRVEVWWDGFLQPDESFQARIPEVLKQSRMLVVVVSAHTWDGQHYVGEELAIAVQSARDQRRLIVPVWVEDIPIEHRPYGITTTVGLSLVTTGCIGCIASRIAERALRARWTEAENRLLCHGIKGLSSGEAARPTLMHEAKHPYSHGENSGPREDQVPRVDEQGRLSRQDLQ